MKGWSGSRLRINLSEGRIEREDLPRDELRSWIGGRGLNAHLLFNESQPGRDPFHPDTPFCLAVGPLTGSCAPCAAIVSVASRSPLLEPHTYAHASMGGHWGAEVKLAGYDPLVSETRAAELGVELKSLEEIFSESDFITLHVPLTPDTHHLINADALRKCKSTAILINTSRGPVVDADALYRALRDGDIAYAALDVTDPEPIAADSPLLTLPNAIVVPHIASASVATRARMAVIAAQNLLAGLRDEPLPAWVNPEVRR